MTTKQEKLAASELLGEAANHESAAHGHHHDSGRLQRAKRHVSARASSDGAIEATADAGNGSKLDKPKPAE